MLNLERVAQEFAFLRDKLKEISGMIGVSQYAEANFLLGTLHVICHNHALTVSQLIPTKVDPVQSDEVPKDEPTV